MDWKRLRLYAEQSVRDALSQINDTGEQFALVTDRSDTLLGVITDGNIRRALLAGASLESCVVDIMNPTPICTDESVSALQALRQMEAGSLSHVPVLNDGRKVCRVWSLKELQSAAPLSNSVVIMAGGLGTRLGDLTKNCPKPMLHVGGKPILQAVIENFTRAGFHNFFLSVNYLAEVIEEYFGDGSRFNCNIQYLHESKRLGTAGALSLLPPQSAPFIVSNADILTHLNMRCLLREHLTYNSMATMVVKKYSVQIPYGVIECDDGRNLLEIREKPSAHFFISAGIYAISPSALQLVPGDTYFDMPSLFQAVMHSGQKARVMETDDYWLDIGQVPDFERAQNEF